ncbi:efflux transporter outer membrane subunit [Acidocella sp.]|uniref:efflux transporter outer membrane subunit n=1 Tax=Acidocella sp. TaxID=50710 RepID=UPI003CFEF256
MLVWESSSLRRYGVLVAVLSTLPLTGCMVGPDFSTPAAATAPHYVPVDGILPEGTANDPQWWRGFNDPVLDKLISLAYRNNLTLQQAGVHVLQARAELAAAVGELYPQQQAISASYVDSVQSKASPTHIPGADTHIQDLSLGLSASWEIDFWGKYRRAIQAQNAVFLGSIDAYDAALVSLTSSVAQIYIAIRTLQEQIAVANANVAAQQESLRIATVQFNSGQTSQLDVEQAQTQLNITQATLPTLRAQLMTQKDALAVLLGLTPDKISPLLGDGGSIPMAPAAVSVGIPKDLLRMRPDVKQAEQEAAAQCAQLGVAKAQLYPALSLSGTFGFESSNSNGSSLGDLFKWSSHTVSIGPSLQIPIFNYGQLTNQVRAQDAAFEQSILNYQNVVLKAQQEVQDAIAAYVEAQNSVRVLIAANASAKQSVKLAMIRYVDGASDYTTVLNAEQAQLQVQNSLASAQGQVPTALVQLYAALGGGWQIAKGHDVVPDNIKADMAKRTNWGGLLTPQAHAAPADEGAHIQQSYAPDW